MFVAFRSHHQPQIVSTRLSEDLQQALVQRRLLVSRLTSALGPSDQTVSWVLLANWFDSSDDFVRRLAAPSEETASCMDIWRIATQSAEAEARFRSKRLASSSSVSFSVPLAKCLKPVMELQAIPTSFTTPSKTQSNTRDFDSVLTSLWGHMEAAGSKSTVYSDYFTCGPQDRLAYRTHWETPFKESLASLGIQHTVCSIVLSQQMDTVGYC
eukprot:2868635-Amphidinium_carterae.1